MIRVVDRPRSMVLIQALARIIVKVRRALMSPLNYFMRCFSRLLARKISMVALKWGYKGASEWAEDKSFIRYLAVMELNSPPGFRLSDMLAVK